MIIKKRVFLQLVQEEVQRQNKKQELLNRMQELENQISELDNSSPILKEFVESQTYNATPSMMDTGNYNLQQIDGAQQGETENESIFDARPGETVIFNFQDVTIKLQRQLDDLFKVVDAAESKKLNDGDYVKIQGNDILKRGRKFTFNIYRVAGVRYESNPLVGWKVIKNK